MNREQWNTGRKYEKLPEPKKTWEKIMYDDPRWQEMLTQIYEMEDGLMIIDEQKGPGFLKEKWEDNIQPKPKLL